MSKQDKLGLRDRIKILRTGKIMEEKATPFGGSRRVVSFSGLPPQNTLEPTADTYINQGYEKNDDLYSIIDYICVLSASLDYKLMDVKADGTEEVVTNNKFLDLLKNPMPGVNYNQFIQQAIGFRLLTGNGIIYGPKMENGVNKGQSLTLQALPTQNIQIKKADEDMFSNAKKYAFQSNGKLFKFPEGDIGQFMARQFSWNTDERLFGMSALKAGLTRLSSSNDALLNKAMKFQNSGAEGMVGTKNEDASEEEIRGMSDAYERKYGGPFNAGKIVWTSLDATWQRFGLSPVDLQILDSMQLDLQAFARMYRLDAHLVDGNIPSTYNNVREAKASAYTMATIPIVQEFYDMLNEWIVPAYANEGQTLKLKVDASRIKELQKDLEATAKALNQARWAISINEARFHLDLPPHDDPEADIPEGLKADPNFILPEQSKKE